MIDLFDLLGILLARGIIDEPLAINLFEGPPIRSWSRLSGLIERRREERSHYARYFQDFVKRSVKYQIEHNPSKEWTKLKIDNEPEEDLIKQLQYELLSPWERRIAFRKRWVRSIFMRRLRK